MQFGKPVAAIGAAEGDQVAVVDQLATTADEDRCPVGKARPLLMAALGREPVGAALFGSMLRRMETFPLPAG
jgi:hypothetical protein